MPRRAGWGPPSRLRVVLTGLVLIPLAVAHYLLSSGSGKALARGTAIAASATGQSTPAETRWIRRTIAGMTLRQKVGQLFEVSGYRSSVRDTDPQMVKLNQAYYGVDNVAQLIRKYHPGGIIYFNWTNNISSSNPDFTKIARLSNGIQRVALNGGAGLPMVISVDQEGRG
jgi:beta-N-acetylhexosaminidase